MSETWSYSSLDCTSSLRGRLAMTMVDLQGEEGKGQGGGSRGQGERKVEVEGEGDGGFGSYTCLPQKLDCLCVPPCILHTPLPLPLHSAHTTPPSLCTHTLPLPLHTHTPPPSAHTHTQESGCTSYHMRCSTLTMVSLSTLPGDPLPYSQVHIS